MNRIAKDILRIATELVPRIMVTFEKDKDISERDMNAIHFDIQRFIGTLRKNEEMSCIVSRQDDDKEMVITIGFTDHEAMDGIVDSLKHMFEKMGRSHGVKLKIEELSKTEEKN